MKKFSKVLAVFFCLVTAIACGNTHWFCKQKQQDEPVVLGQSSKMVSVYNMGIKDYQLDSICHADGLSNDFKDWVNAFFIDYETKDTIFKHTFIKVYNDNQEEIYIVTEWRDSLAINKRVRK